MKQPNGMILWQGESRIDGAPIVAIVVGLSADSTNTKTGAMLQTYILRADVAPTDAIKSGQDASICGDCTHRGDGTGKGRTCYVNVGQGALAVFRAFQRGKYPRATADQAQAAGTARVVRLGTYGDPAAVPAYVWKNLTMFADSNTGYTHQLNHPSLTPDHIQSITSLCMVSADTPADVQQAKTHNLRYFRIRLEDEALGEKEFVCPASEEAGKRMQCADCMACSGSSKGKSSPVIIAHGSYKKNYRTFRLTQTA